MFYPLHGRLSVDLTYECSMGLLGELVEVLNLCFTAEHGDIILDILRNLSRSSRFNISLSFLGKTGGKAVSCITRHLWTVFFEWMFKLLDSYCKTVTFNMRH